MATKKKIDDSTKIRCVMHRGCRLILDGVTYEGGHPVEVTQTQLDGWRAIMSKAAD